MKPVIKTRITTITPKQGYKEIDNINLEEQI